MDAMWHVACGSRPLCCRLVDSCTNCKMLFVLLAGIVPFTVSFRPRSFLPLSLPCTLSPSFSLTLLCLKHTFRQFTYFVKQPQLTDKQTDRQIETGRTFAWLGQFFHPFSFTYPPPPSHSFSSASSSSCCVCLLRRVAFLLLQSNCVLLFFNFFKLLLLFALSLVSLSSLSLFLSLPLSLPSCSVGKQIIC